MQLNIGPEISTSRNAIINVSTTFPEGSTTIVYLDARIQVNYSDTGAGAWPGRILVIKDIDGGLSLTKSITVSTISTSGYDFIYNGSTTNSFSFHKPFESVSLVNRTPYSYSILNTYANPTDSKHLVNSLNVSTANVNFLSCGIVSTNMNIALSNNPILTIQNFNISSINGFGDVRPYNLAISSLNFIKEISDPNFMSLGFYTSFGRITLVNGTNFISLPNLNTNSIVLCQRVSTNNSTEIGHLTASNNYFLNNISFTSQQQFSGVTMSGDQSSIDWCVFNN
jgi:hypothetical protein